jgi:hypothetical protein
MSMMFSSKSSGGGVVVVRLAMTAIVPARCDKRAAARWRQVAEKPQSTKTHARAAQASPPVTTATLPSSENNSLR